MPYEIREMVDGVLSDSSGSGEGPAPSREQRSAETQLLAIATLKKYGEFTPAKTRLREFATAEILDYWEMDEVRKLIAAADKKAAKMLDGVRTEPAGYGVDWRDAEVVAAVVYFTAVDADMAEIRNRSGWSRAHTSAGHWCHANLETNRTEALKKAREILVSYSVQLRAAGILE